MAKDKKSFVLYADLIEVVSELDDLQKGQLFNHILEYVNDKDPEPPSDLIRLVFIPIKQSLKRDLVKYEQRAERARINGNLGGRPKTQKTQRVSSKPKEPDSVTVNVTDSVTDTVTDNVNESTLKKVPKKAATPLVFPFDSKIFKEQWDIWKQYKKDEHRFSFKSQVSEQAQLKKLGDFAEGSEKKAVAILHQSIENGWKGLFQIEQNGKQGNQRITKYDGLSREEVIEKTRSEFEEVRARRRPAAS